MKKSIFKTSLLALVVIFVLSVVVINFNKEAIAERNPRVTYEGILSMLNQCTLYTQPNAGINETCDSICQNKSGGRTCVQAYAFLNNVTLPYQCNFGGGMGGNKTLICNCCNVPAPNFSFSAVK